MVENPLPNETKEKILPRRLVVKCGTDNLCSLKDGKRKLDQGIFDDYARQIVELQKQGVEVIIVSSGAIKAGREKFEELGFEIEDTDKQVLAAVGQGLLMKRWEEAFRKFGKTVGQILVTFTNWSSERERNEIKQTIFDLLGAEVTPVINENDPVSDQEIILWERRISENDRLAKMVALGVGADAILFLTDEGGIYTTDPKIDPNAQLYKEISVRDKPEDLIDPTKSSSSESGTGGMKAKLREARRCAKQGLSTAIAGNEEDVISRFARGESVGTKIIDKADRLE